MKKIFNKLVEEPTLFFTIPFFLPLIIVIIILKPLVKIRFGLINSDRIGHLAANTELYLCRKKYKEKEFLDLFYFPTIPCNLQLAKMIKRKIIIFPKFVLRPFDLVFRTFDCLKSFNAIKTSYGDHDTLNYLDSKKNQIVFSHEEKIDGKKFLKKFNLINNKYICLTVRDEKYVENNWKNKKTMNYHKHRNMEIDDFIPTCKYLNEKGYYVIRMGSDVKKKMSYKNSKFIDYAASNMRTDFLDIYILSNCYFNISSVMGLDAVPFIFRKPILYLSSIPIGHFSTSSKKFINVTVNHYDRENKRFLSTSEIFNKNCAFVYSKNDFIKKNIDLIPLTKLEIKKYSIEMLQFVKNNFKISNKAKKINNFYWKNYIKVNQDYPLFKFLHGKIKCVYSTINLNRNKHFLK